MKRILVFLMAFLLVGVSIASALTYEDMARYPDQHYGEQVTLLGKVVQPDYTSSEAWAFRLYTGKSTYGGFSEDDVMVGFLGLPSDGRLLEGDIVVVKGVFGGMFAYETVLGATREIPLIAGTSYNIQEGNF